jgi:hypothetical protein
MNIQRWLKSQQKCEFANKMQSIKTIVESIQQPWEQYNEVLSGCKSIFDDKVTPTC